MTQEPVTRAWIDSRQPMCHEQLWGLTLLERNLRELERLGIREAVLLTDPSDDPRKHFRRALPARMTVQLKAADSGDPWGSLRQMLAARPSPVLALEGNALNDRRVLKRLLQSRSSVGALSPDSRHQAGAALFTESDVPHLSGAPETGLTPMIRTLQRRSKIKVLNLSDLDPYLISMRKRISPFLIPVVNSKDLDGADDHLKQWAQKGTNDFVARYIHPPLEFGITRFLLKTEVRPNHVTFFNILLAAIATLLFIKGHLLIGLLFAAAKGVLDGVDGKLARMRLQFSRFGDRLDHFTDTIFDALWYLALGWHFSKGDMSAPAAAFAAILFGAYWVERIVPGLFKKLHRCEIYDFAEIDRFARLIGSRMNNNVWVLMIGTVCGAAQTTFYFISLWMLGTALWHTGRFLQVTWRSRSRETRGNKI